MRVLITGGTGFVGRAVSEALVARGHQVVLVSRIPGPGRVTWDEALLSEELTTTDALLNLAGENLFAKRWSPVQKAKLVHSRVEKTDHIARLAANARQPGRGGRGPRCFVSASAVGYYGSFSGLPGDDPTLDEGSAAGSDFLAGLCRDWEAACEPARRGGLRVAVARIGVVLSPEGGALRRMLLPFKLGIGGRWGSGEQVLSWIHRADLAALLVHLLESEGACGAFNATAPEPIRVAEFAREFGRALGRPALLPVPAFGLRLAVGEVAEILLRGQRALPKRTLESGFRFRFAAAQDALADLFARR